MDPDRRLFQIIVNAINAGFTASQVVPQSLALARRVGVEADEARVLAILDRPLSNFVMPDADAFDPCP